MPNDSLRAAGPLADASYGVSLDFLNSAPCSFLSFNDNGTILFINDVLLSLLGFDRDEIQQLHVDKLLTVAGRIFYQTHFFPLLKLQGSASEIYLSLRSKAGGSIPVLVNASRHTVNGENINHCVLLSMHERHKFEDALIVARNAAEEAVRVKDEFLATISHELRTPLTAIVGWLHILRESQDDPIVIKEAIEVLERNAEAQSQLVGDLLDFSRITSGKLRLNVQPVELTKVIHDALDVVRPAADARQISVTHILDPNAGPISGDPDRLQQILWNLLSNAIKFTPKGGRVRVELRRINSHAEIRVQDSGEGIPPEFLPYVFERFRQADGSKTRVHGGLGLGLAITKDLVELHGGLIRAESEGAGTGATFELHFPVLSVSAAKAHEVAKQSSDANDQASKPKRRDRLSGINVVVVDDNSDSLTVIRRVLEREGARVTPLNEAKLALATLTDHGADVLISDIGMPGMDGYELIRTLRGSSQPLCAIPAIALTAHATANDRINTLASGFQAFLTKPVDPKELVLTVVNVAHRWF